MRYDLIADAVEYYIEHDLFKSCLIMTEQSNLFSDTDRSNEFSELAELIRIKKWARDQDINQPGLFD